MSGYCGHIFTLLENPFELPPASFTTVHYRANFLRATKSCFTSEPAIIKGAGFQLLSPDFLQEVKQPLAKLSVAWTLPSNRTLFGAKIFQGQKNVL
jgi:hypothetical protein